MYLHTWGKTDLLVYMDLLCSLYSPCDFNQQGYQRASAEQLSRSRSKCTCRFHLHPTRRCGVERVMELTSSLGNHCWMHPTLTIWRQLSQPGLTNSPEVVSVSRIWGGGWYYISLECVVPRLLVLWPDGCWHIAKMMVSCESWSTGSNNEPEQSSISDTKLLTSLVILCRKTPETWSKNMVTCSFGATGHVPTSMSYKILRQHEPHTFLNVVLASPEDLGIPRCLICQLVFILSLGIPVHHFQTIGTFVEKTSVGHPICNAPRAIFRWHTPQMVATQHVLNWISRVFGGHLATSAVA